MPTVSVVMPVYNVESFVAQAIDSVLAQSYRDFELLIVDDCSPDDSMAICRRYDDPRVRIIHHRENRGLAGARNTGIRHASGQYIAFLDSDDSWHPDKLEQHVRHLDTQLRVGISFSRSVFMEPDGRMAGYYQMPRLTGIDAAHCLCRNPVGNGSAAVVRRATLEQIRYCDDRYGIMETRFFDEDLRQSEDIECWTRILLSTDWQMEGLPDALTCYRLNAGGLSAQCFKQYRSWETMITKLRPLAPALFARWERPARGYQLRYLSRQAIRIGDGATAVRLVNRALYHNPAMLYQESFRTFSTLGAAYLLWLMPGNIYRPVEQLAQRLIGSIQHHRIRRELTAQPT